MYRDSEAISCLGMPNRCFKCRTVIAVGAFCETCSAAIAERIARRSLAPVVVVEADVDDEGYEIEARDCDDDDSGDDWAVPEHRGMWNTHLMGRR